MNNDDPGSRSGTARPFESRALEVDVVVVSDAWAARLPDHEMLARRAALAALRRVPADAGGVQAGDGAPIELCVSLADDATLRDLNARYRGQDKPTNVLAFAYEEADTPEAVTPEAVPGLPRSMGDVILSLETLEREAAAQGKSLRDHFCHLVVHGCLHLVGFDHEERAEAEEMEALEVQVLAGLGIADPYAEERGAPLSLGGAA